MLKRSFTEHIFGCPSYKHIFVVVDGFSRFVWLFPTKSTGTKEVTKHLKTIFDLFGKASHLISDRGTAFTSNEFQNFVSTNNIKHKKIVVAAPWANGIVERVNRILKCSLTKTLAEARERKQRLGTIQYVINNTYHVATKASPSRMLGYDQRSHSDHALFELTRTLSEIDNTLENSSRITVRNKAEEATKLIKEYNKNYQDLKCKKPS